MSMGYIENGKYVPVTIKDPDPGALQYSKRLATLVTGTTYTGTIPGVMKGTYLLNLIAYGGTQTSLWGSDKKPQLYMYGNVGGVGAPEYRFGGYGIINFTPKFLVVDEDKDVPYTLRLSNAGLGTYTALDIILTRINS